MKKLKQVSDYLIGWYRYHVYYNAPRLLREHIKEQFEMRLKLMDEECYNEGSCKMCGCNTTALQMADKACDKPCYPKMVDKETWRGFCNGVFKIDGYWVTTRKVYARNGSTKECKYIIKNSIMITEL